MTLKCQPADVVAAGTLVVVLVADVLLVRRGHASLSERHGDWAAGPARWILAGLEAYLVLHLWGRHLPVPPALRRLDPLAAASRRLR